MCVCLCDDAINSKVDLNCGKGINSFFCLVITVSLCCLFLALLRLDKYLDAVSELELLLVTFAVL